MKKIIFKFWISNVIVSILLFIAYRILIAKTESSDAGFLETILHILDILLNLALSTVYLAGMILCSLPLLLNLIKSIRSKYLFSLLSFLGLPLLCVVFITIIFITDFQPYKESGLANIVIFPITYLFLTIIQFLLFRKRIENLQTE